MMFLKNFSKLYVVLTLAIIASANNAFGMGLRQDSKAPKLRVNVSDNDLAGSTTVSPEGSLRSPIKIMFISPSTSLGNTPAVSLRGTPATSTYSSPIASRRVSPAPSTKAALISNPASRLNTSRALSPNRLTFQQSGTTASINSSNTACITETIQQQIVQDNNTLTSQNQVLSDDNGHSTDQLELNTVNDNEDEDDENNDENSNKGTSFNISQAEKIINEIIDNDDAWSTKQTERTKEIITTRTKKDVNLITWTMIRNIAFYAHCKSLENPLYRDFSTVLTKQLINEKIQAIKAIINNAYANKTPCRIYKCLCFNNEIKTAFELSIEKDPIELADDDIVVLAETLFDLKQSNNATPKSEIMQHCLTDATIEAAFKEHKAMAPSFRLKQAKRGASAPRLELNAINENKTSNDQKIEVATIDPLSQVLDNNAKAKKFAKKYIAERSVSRFETELLYKAYDDDIRKIADKISLIANEKDASAILEQQINSLTESKTAQKTKIKRTLFIKTMIRMTALLAFCKNQPEFDKDAVFSKPEVFEQLSSLIGHIMLIIKKDVWNDIKEGKIKHLKMKYKDSANTPGESLLREHWDEIWKNIYQQLPTSPYLNETKDGTTTLEKTIENKVFQKKVGPWWQCCSQELTAVPLEFTPEDQLQLMKNIARLQNAQALPPSDDNCGCSCVIQ